MAGVRVESREKYAFVQANRARFSSGALQWQVLIALCLRQRRFAVAKAGKRRDAKPLVSGGFRLTYSFQLQKTVRGIQRDCFAGASQLTIALVVRGAG